MYTPDQLADYVLMKIAISQEEIAKQREAAKTRSNAGVMNAVKKVGPQPPAAPVSPAPGGPRGNVRLGQ